MTGPYRLGMLVTVNGKAMELPEPTTVRQLIEKLDLGKAACAAEVNRRLIPHKEHPDRLLQPGDVVELVSLVGGG